MYKLTAALAVLSIAAILPAQAEVFSIGSPFVISATNSPSTFTASLPLTTGLRALTQNVSVTIDIIPVNDAAQDEWIVFQYRTVGAALSLPNVNWAINQIGLTTTVATNFVGDFTQFDDANGNPFNQTQSIFSQGLMNNPVPGGAGNGEGTLGFSSPNPAGALGPFFAFSNPFSVVTNALGTTQVFGFYQALEFQPQQVIPPPSAPEPWSITILGAGLLGLGYTVRRRAG